MSEVASLPLRALVEARREEIKAAVARHKGLEVAVIGSVARGEETPHSDIDLLVKFAEGTSLFDLIRLEDELVELLGHPIDLVSYGGLKPRDYDIRNDAVWL